MEAMEVELPSPEIFSAQSRPATVTYCHCKDCRRVSGAPVSALAAFTSDALTWEPELGPAIEINEGVRRWFCGSCGSPLAAQYSYLPDQVYVPVGLFAALCSHRTIPISKMNQKCIVSWRKSIEI